MCTICFIFRRTGRPRTPAGTTTETAARPDPWRCSAPAAGNLRPLRFAPWWTSAPTTGVKTRRTNIQTYTFTVVLRDQTEMTEDLAEALAAAGCDDGLAGSSDGIAAVIFDRQAESLEQAVRSAIADVQKAGCHTAWVRIEPQDLVAAGEQGSAG